MVLVHFDMPCRMSITLLAHWDILPIASLTLFLTVPTVLIIRLINLLMTLRLIVSLIVRVLETATPNNSRLRLLAAISLIIGVQQRS